MFITQKKSLSTDADLLARFKSTQDMAVLSELYLRYSSLVYGVCLKYLKDRDESKDMVMQIYEKMPSRLRNHEVTQFKSWLYVTTRNECLMLLRSRKGKFSQEIDAGLMENDLVMHLDEEPEMESNLSKLERCIDKLAQEQQLCVRLFFLQEKCYRDISGTTGFDLNKVKSHIQNGKRNLKICMEGNE